MYFHRLSLLLQGTIVFTSLHASHMKDEETWKNPELFEPERFLDEFGQFSPKLDKSTPFGAGKRVQKLKCIAI